jgi:hypothetical protein
MCISGLIAEDTHETLITLSALKELYKKNKFFLTMVQMSFKINHIHFLLYVFLYK